MLADAVDAVDADAGEGFGHGPGRRFEGLFIPAEPDRLDYLAADALVYSIRDGLDLWQLGHPELFSQRLRTAGVTEPRHRRPTGA